MFGQRKAPILYKCGFVNQLNARGFNILAYRLRRICFELPVEVGHANFCAESLEIMSKTINELRLILKNCAKLLRREFVEEKLPLLALIILVVLKNRLSKKSFVRKIS